MTITKYSYGVNVCASVDNNVIDKYKQWEAEEIRADLDPRRSELVSICMNYDKNINIAASIRASNAFLNKATYVCGRRRYDKRATCGTGHYEHIYHAETFDEIYDLLKPQGYTFFAIDNIEEYKPCNLYDVSFPEKSVFVFGNEGDGLEQEVIEKCDMMVKIGQRGSVRSLNVACAAAVCFAEYGRQHQLGE